MASNELLSKLQHQLEDERDGVQEYKALIVNAYNDGCDDLAITLRGILHDEETHALLIERMISQVKK